MERHRGNPTSRIRNALTGRELEIHGTVSDVLHTSNELQTSPHKVLAHMFQNADRVVVKNFNHISNVIYQVHKYLKPHTQDAPMGHINQRALVALIHKLSAQITTPDQIQDKTTTKNIPLAIRLVCHISLLLQPRVRR